MKNDFLEKIKKNIIGSNNLIETPFGAKHLFYADYVASGRGLKCVEEKLLQIENSYANTHTEDDYTGNFMTNLLHQAEKKIKQFLNADENYRIISTGSGCTGALEKLQQILGIYIPPATREIVHTSMINCQTCKLSPEKSLRNTAPIVFVGPYEHHTNELMWRESLAEVRKIKLDKNGFLDLEDLKAALSDEKYKNRKKIASFSAGSNITGVLSDVYKIAEICHNHGAVVFFDFAASAPYVKINMAKNSKQYFDAIFFSPHKFLGGPATSGIVVFHKKLYNKNLPPTVAGGGTVDFVGYDSQDYSKDIETREKAGTPPILQTIKTALVLEIKKKIGEDFIEEKELEYTKYFLKELEKIEEVELVGKIPPEKRLSIISFNIRHEDRFLHPRFVTRLMNDLFGIQTRAGCSCAGPYGHSLLGISLEESHKYRKLIKKEFTGIKPGWVRLNLHYTFSRSDLDFILKVIDFISKNGKYFLSIYDFDLKSGLWIHKTFKEKIPELSLDNDFALKEIDSSEIETFRETSFEIAKKEVEKLKNQYKEDFEIDAPEIEEVKQFFSSK